jgi:hypothetical protein
VLFVGVDFKPELKAIYNREEFFLQVPMLSDKALFNSLIIYTKMEGSYTESSCYDMNTFFRDIQYNPFNSAKIFDFLLFSLWEANYILTENPSNYKPLILDTNNLIIDYPSYTIKKNNFEILGNYVDKIGLTLYKYIEGKRSIPLLFKARYCELNGFSYGEVFKKKFSNAL